MQKKNIMIFIITISAGKRKGLQWKHREKERWLMDEFLESMATVLSENGCGRDAAEKAERLLAAGRTEDLIRHLRLCRCGLMEDLHESQRRVDRMDYLIRKTEKTIKNKS